MSSGLYSGASGIALGVGLYRQVAGLWSGASGLMSGFGNPIPPLFAGGAPGAWFDFTDTSTWYQDAARTTPAATLGDVVGLVLDKSRGLALGPELVTNGDFSSGTTGWTGGSNGVLTSVSGGLRITNTGGINGRATSAAITTVAGKWYQITVTTVGKTTTAYQVTIRDSVGAGASAFDSGSIFTEGVKTYCFLATAAAHTVVIFSIGADGTYAEYDNISVKLLAGNHASQATTAQKPLRARIPFGGRRNICVYTETHSGAQLGTAAGTTPPTITGTTYEGLPVESIAFPSGAGTYSASRRVGSTGGQSGQWIVALGNTYTCSSFVALSRPLTGSEAITVYCTGTTGGWDVVLNSGTSTPTTLTRRSATQVASGGTGGQVGFYVYTSGTLTSPITVYITKMQAELGSSATAYQKVVADWDVTESGVTSIPALYFDGSDDSLATAAIDFATCTSDGAARRNLLTFPSVFNDAAWLKSNTSVAATGYSDYTGGSNARKLVESASNATHFTYQAATLVAGSATISVYAKAAERTSIEVYFSGTYFTGSGRFNLSAGTCTSVGAGTATITDVGGGWYRCSVTTTGSTGESAQFRIFLVDANNYIGDGTSGVYIYRAQMEAGSTATAFQDIGTDKMTVFAGVEKLSDASPALLLELSVSVSANAGTFYVSAPEAVSAGNSYALASRGSVLPAAPAKSAVGTAPDTAVLTGLMDISGDSAILRRDGSQVGATTSDQGTGNYGNYPLYLGRRGGSSFPFKGYMIGHMVIVGKLANASEIAAVEATERAATGAY